MIASTIITAQFFQYLAEFYIERRQKKDGQMGAQQEDDNHGS